MAPLAPPLTRPLVLSKAKHCQAVLSKAKHWHAVMSEVPFKTSTPFKKILKFWGGHGPPGPPTNEATGTEQGQALPSSTEQGQALACFLHEIFLTNFS